jgi:hypothetical protein
MVVEIMRYFIPIILRPLLTYDLTTLSTTNIISYQTVYKPIVAHTKTFKYIIVYKLYMKKNNNYKLAKIMQYNLTDDEILELEQDYHGDIDRYLYDHGFLESDDDAL